MATESRIEELKVNLEQLRKEFRATPNYTLLDDLGNSFSDLYKSAHGFRPRHVNYNETSELELLIMLDDLYRYMEQEEEWERQEQERVERERQERLARVRAEIEEASFPDWKRQLQGAF